MKNTHLSLNTMHQLFILLSILFLSCQFQIIDTIPSIDSSASVLSDSTLGKITESRKESNHLSIISEEGAKWNNTNSLYGTWTMLERDSIGYLVYKPCNGSTPGINLSKKEISIHWRLEGPDKFIIKDIYPINNNTAIYIQAINEHGIKAEFNVRIVNSKLHLYLWNWTIHWGEQQGGPWEDKWVMTHNKFEKEFRVVDNPCPHEMKVEKEFLLIEFE